MVCRNICEMFGCKPSFEHDQYILGKKYCKRCEMYYYKGMFCPCCGMQLRLTLTSKKGKERIRQRKKHHVQLVAHNHTTLDICRSSQYPMDTRYYLYRIVYPILSYS